MHLYSNLKLKDSYVFKHKNKLYIDSDFSNSFINMQYAVSYVLCYSILL